MSWWEFGQWVGSDTSGNVNKDWRPMISFKVRYDEATMLWQYAHEGQARWSEPMRYAKMNAALGREIQAESIARSETEDKSWHKPNAHSVRSHRSDRDKLMDLYEIRGGKVVKLGYTAKDRTNDQANEILALLEGVEL